VPEARAARVTKIGLLLDRDIKKSKEVQHGMERDDVQNRVPCPYSRQFNFFSLLPERMVKSLPMGKYRTD
jgi:hypothetical protein